MIQQGVHGRIAAVALDQLQAQAFTHVPGEDAGGLEALHHLQHRLDPLRRAAEADGRVGQVQPQVAAVVDPVAQGRGDGGVGDIEAGDRRLGGQMFGQGRLPGRQPALAVLVVVEGAAGAGLGPVDLAAGVGAG